MCNSKLRILGFFDWVIDSIQYLSNIYYFHIYYFQFDSKYLPPVAALKVPNYLFCEKSKLYSVMQDNDPHDILHPFLIFIGGIILQALFFTPNNRNRGGRGCKMLQRGLQDHHLYVIYSQLYTFKLDLLKYYQLSKTNAINIFQI